jgi:predicted transcriptional regulator
MARPRGHRLSKPAWDDALRTSGLSLTEVAEQADIPRATLSVLLGGHSRASLPMTTKIGQAVSFNPATLFPTLLPLFDEAPE